jgi:hypothetical protein
MSQPTILQRILDGGIVAVVRSESPDQLVGVVKALADGGVTAAEITFTVPRAIDVIRDGVGSRGGCRQDFPVGPRRSFLFEGASGSSAAGPDDADRRGRPLDGRSFSQGRGVLSWGGKFAGRLESGRLGRFCQDYRSCPPVFDDRQAVPGRDRRMIRVFRAFRLAVAFLTILRVPVKDDEVTAASLADARFAYPVVGLLIGLGLASIHEVFRKFGVAPAPSAFWLVALMALVTGGLHLDGLADTAGGHA